MADRFEMRQTRRGVLARLQPLIHGALDITGSSQMMGKEFGLPLHEISETLLQCRCDAGVQFLPCRAQPRSGCTTPALTYWACYVGCRYSHIKGIPTKSPSL